MSCVTPLDLGKPIAAIVERCGPPISVSSLDRTPLLAYADGGEAISVWFDADQMRARILQFTTFFTSLDVTLPFQSGEKTIALGHTTLADAESALADDADVTTENGAAFRSTDHNEVVLACISGENVLRAAFVGERTSLVQSGIIASKLGDSPLDYVPPVPRDDWPKAEMTGSQATIFRIDVDAYGIVRKVTIVVPSRDAAFDASRQLRLGEAKFRPATLDKRPVSGTSFVQLRH